MMRKIGKLLINLDENIFPIQKNVYLKHEYYESEMIQEIFINFFLYCAL